MIYSICKFLLVLQELLCIPIIPSKKARGSSSKLTPAAFEAAAQVVAPAAQLSTASSLSKGKEIPSAPLL
jgi:hypothetical protein